MFLDICVDMCLQAGKSDFIYYKTRKQICSCFKSTIGIVKGTVYKRPNDEDKYTMIIKKKPDGKIT